MDLAVLFVAYVSLILIISLHELGHALEMRRYGVPLKEICLLGIGPKLFSFRLRRTFGDTPVTIRLLPLGAFVAPSTDGVERIKELGYRERAQIYGAGIVVNIALAGMFFGCALILRFAAVGTEILDQLLVLALCVTFALAVMMGRRSISAYVLPLLSILVFIALVWAMVHAGPTNVVQVGVPTLVDPGAAKPMPAADRLRHTFAEAANYSLLLAGLNLLPFHPLDGGKLVDNVIHAAIGKLLYARYETAITLVLAIPFLGFLGLAIASTFINGSH